VFTLLIRQFLRLIVVCEVLMGPGGAAFGADDASWVSRTWQTDEGLPDNIVAGIAQTANGYLWVATCSGLARFDGVRFSAFAPAKTGSMGVGAMTAMWLDRAGRLWLAKGKGVVVCVDANEVRVFKPEDGSVIQQRARELAEDSEGTVWVAYDSQQLFRIRDGRMREWKAAESPASRGVWQLATAKDGQLWFAKGGEIGVFRNGAFVTLLRLENDSFRISAARPTGLWISSGANLFRFEEGGTLKTIATLRGSLAEEPASVMFEDHDGGVWLGTRKSGVFRYSEGTAVNLMPPLYEVWSLAEDREGSIWVGTRGGGLSRLRPRVAEVQDVVPGVAMEPVSSVCEDKAGTVWAAAGNGLLSRNAGLGWVLMSTNADWAVPRVLCVAAAPEGGLWLGTRSNGIFHCRAGMRLNLRKADGLASDYVRSLHVTRSGDVWIGTDAPGALQRLRAGRLQSFALPSGSPRVSAMVEDDQGRFWATTIDGHLLRVDGDSLTDQALPGLGDDAEFRCLWFTPDGSLWIGTMGQGLLRWSEGKLTHFRAEQGLHEDYIAQLASDLEGRLWFAGNRGISSVKQADLEAVAAGRLTQLRSRTFGRDQGLPALQPDKTYWPGALRSSTGTLWIPTLTGVARVDPGKLEEHRVNMPVVIERMSVDGVVAADWEFQRLSFRSNKLAQFGFFRGEPRLDLSPGHHQVEFEFTALSHASPENVYFKYQLEGLEENWVNSGKRRVANYSHLPPGEYRFRVSAGDQETLPGELGATLTVVSLPHYGETAWFRVGGGAAGVVLLTGVIVLALRQRYRRKLERMQQRQALERERTRIAQDLHDDLGSGLVEISLGSELAQDPGLAPDDAREHAREIGARAKEMVTALDEIVWAVNPKHDDVPSLAAYFCQFAQHFLKPTTLRCHLEIAQDLPPRPLSAEQRHTLFLAFKEALSNAVQHSGATDLWLSISVVSSELHLSVSDNGQGLAPAAAGRRVGADGLSNMQARLRQLGGRCGLSDRPGRGLTVGFVIPLATAKDVVQQ
jgi:signal transduction histidine kinase/ligand-binding sensor domain-containing protein